MMSSGWDFNAKKALGFIPPHHICQQYKDLSGKKKKNVLRRLDNVVFSLLWKSHWILSHLHFLFK